jgi:hypothetical protein
MRNVLYCEECDEEDPCILIPCKVNEDELLNSSQCPIEGNAVWKVFGEAPDYLYKKSEREK